MLVDGILELIYKAFMFVMGGFQPLHFNIDLKLVDIVEDFLAFIFFILPIKQVMGVIPLIILIIGFRILIAFIKTIWDLLPLL